MNPPVRQQALSLVARVERGEEPGVEKLLHDGRQAVLAALGGVRTLHFARFALLPPASDVTGDKVSRLVFESNLDGELGPHIEELWAEAGALFGEFFARCVGRPKIVDQRAFARFVADHSQSAGAFFVGCPGLSAEQVRADAKLRAAIDAYLDAERPTLLREPPGVVVERLRSHLERLVQERAEFKLESVTRGLSAEALSAGDALRPYLFDLTRAVLAGIPHELVQRARGAWGASGLDAPGVRARLKPNPGRNQQAGLVHLVPVKAGRHFRKALRLALGVAQELSVRGRGAKWLSGLGSLHFARWVLLDDGRLLFLCHHDGSTEALLGELIDHAASLLNLVWSNTVDFPQTTFKLMGGVRDEERFQRWVRAYEVPTAIAYSAYPSLGAREVLVNAALRETLARDLDHASVERFLELA